MKWMNRSWIFNLWQTQEPDWIMWGTAQVMFVNNPLSGLLVTAALFLQHPQWALGGLLATIVSTVSAVLLKESRSADISVKQLSPSSLGLHFLRLSYCSNSILHFALTLTIHTEAVPLGLYGYGGTLAGICWRNLVLVALPAKCVRVYAVVSCEMWPL